VLLILGSAVRLPYHQPEKKDISVFLARTELKQQKFVGTSRLSWKQFVPPANLLHKFDDDLSTGAVSSEKPSRDLSAESNDTNNIEASVEHCVSEFDVLPDLSSFCSKSETVPNNDLVTVTQAEPSSKSTQRKLLLLSPVKSGAVTATSEPSTSLDSDVLKQSENSTQHVEMLLEPVVGKKLLLNPIDRNKSGQLTSDVGQTVALDVGESTEVEDKALEYMVDEHSDGDEVAKILPPQSAAAPAKILPRVSHRMLPTNVPLPQLSGNPNDFIELDADDDDDGDYRRANSYGEGVEQLMERLLQHSRGSSHHHKPKTVEIRLLLLVIIIKLLSLSNHYSASRVGHL